MLIILGGLPGVGKTAIARELARRIGAVHLRVDSVEQAMRASGKLSQPLEDAGYRIAYAVAEDNLHVGRTVIADCVNPLRLTRDAWLEVANRAHTAAVQIEIVRSDPAEHRRRVESRVSDIPGLILPVWDEVVSREYEPWHRERLVIDTSCCGIEQAVEIAQNALATMAGRSR